MRSIRLIRFAAFTLAAVSGIGFALPAQADVSRTMERVREQHVAQTGRAACGRSFADARCADYQNRLLEAVAMTGIDSTERVSIDEVSSRQLDALLSTVD